MLIILGLYIIGLWLIFSKYKLIRLGWVSGAAAALIGSLILATFLGLFHYLTPSGRLTVTGRVVEVTPNVTGQIMAIPVKPNVPVKTDDVLFQIDPAPFEYKVRQLEASLAGARQQVEILKENYLQATANVVGLTAQVAFNAKRLADIQQLAAEDAIHFLCHSLRYVHYPCLRAGHMPLVRSERGEHANNFNILLVWAKKLGAVHGQWLVFRSAR
jgi:multidrug efflux pump subunit AcrA (membrane-fusion protein)